MAPWGRRTNSIIYNKLLEVLNETHRKEINRYCDNAMREVMWKFLNYLGVADNMHYGELDNDNIWETIHNE
jgi:recombinational DNA repair protein (RecF pathway)